MDPSRTTEPERDGPGDDGRAADGRRRTVRSAERPPSVLAVEVVADARGCDPTDLEPLYAVVDPDALDALVAGGRGGGPRVAFEYEGVAVEVRDDGGLVVAADGQ